MGQGPPVSACALPWANNAWNAPRDSVPAELASSTRCSDRAARPSPHSPKSGGFLASDSNRGKILDPFGGLPTGCPPWPGTALSGNGRRRGLWPHQAGRWGRVRGRGSCHVVTIGPHPAPPATRSALLPPGTHTRAPSGWRAPPVGRKLRAPHVFSAVTSRRSYQAGVVTVSTAQPLDHAPLRPLLRG